MTTGTPGQYYSASSRPRRSRGRSLLPLVVAVWLVLEIWLLTLVGRTAGGFVVLLLLIAGVVLGSVVIKRAGRRAFQKLAATLQARQRGDLSQVGGRSDGNGLLMLAGLLLMIPGPLSDAAGLLLLVPGVRRVVRGATERALDRRVRAAYPGYAGGGAGAGAGSRGDGTNVVQGEVVHDDETPRQRPDDGPRPPLTP